MRLLFVVTGFGYGDSTRVDAIIKEILKKKPKTEIMIMGYNTSYDYFKNRFKTLKFQGYKFSDRYDSFKSIPFIIKNLFLPLSWLITTLKSKKQLKKFNPDLVISDFEPVASLIARSIKKRSLVVFGYNPKQFLRYKKKTLATKLQARFIEMIYRRFDKILIPSLKPDKDYDNVIFSQPIIKTQPSELPSEEKLMKKLNLKRKPVIVHLGGSDFGLDLAKKILQFYEKYNEEFIFFGSSEKMAAKHYTFKENFMEYIKVAKCVITLAGQLNLAECIAFKKPMLIFPIRNHIEQLLNAQSITKIAQLGDPDNVEESLENFFKNLKRNQSRMDKIKQKINGAEKAAKIIIETATNPYKL